MGHDVRIKVVFDYECPLLEPRILTNPHMIQTGHIWFFQLAVCFWVLGLPLFTVELGALLTFHPMKVWSQVLRRGSYKGNVAPRGSQCLPMDCSTLPGLLVLVTCWLTARGLNHVQITTCHELLQNLERLVNVSATCKMLPHYKDSWIEVSNNMIHADDLRYIVHECGLTWKQLLILLFITFSF